MTLRNPLNFALRPTRAETMPVTLAARIFLACPYSHQNPIMHVSRALSASEAAARLMVAGYSVFSPISHGHAVCEADIAGTVGTDAEAWAAINDVVLTVCDALVVLGLPGCIESVGVRREVSLAAHFGLPVNLLRFFEGGIPVVERDVDPTLWSDDEERV